MALVAAVRLVYGDRRYRAAALLVAVASLAFLAWSSQVITYFPQGGFFVDVDAVTGTGLLMTSLLIAITYPLHWYAWRRAQRSAASQGIGFLGALLGVGSMSCCAPLLLPGLLGVAGFSGSSLLSLNIRLHQLRLPLVALAVFFLAISLWAGTRNVTRACRLAPPRAPA